MTRAVVSDAADDAVVDTHCNGGGDRGRSVSGSVGDVLSSSDVEGLPGNSADARVVDSTCTTSTSVDCCRVHVRLARTTAPVTHHP